MPRRLRTLVALPLAALAATGLAATSPTERALAAPAPGSLTLMCPGLGQAEVRLSGPLLHEDAVHPAAGDPVRVAGVGVDLADATGGRLALAATGEGTRCTVPVTALPWSSVLDATGLRREQLSPGATAGGTVTVVLQADTATVLADAARERQLRAAGVRTSSSDGVQAAAVANDPAGYGPVTAFPYRSQLAAYLSGRPGSVAVAWRPAGSSTIHSYTKGSATNVTASIVKVQVMATVMYRAQAAGRGLTSWEKQQMVPMIRHSDNAATTRLWNHVGGGPAVAQVNRRMGLRDTTPGPGGFWGLTVTSAPDQVVLVDHFARRNPVLSDSMRSYGLSLMRSVAPDQDWGVTAGPGDDIAVKNGWLPRTVDGWHVNSVGYNHKLPRPYSAAVLTHSTTASMATEVSTIEGASRIMWSRTRVARGDFTGDHRADLVGLKGSDLMLLANNGSGSLRSAVRVGTGWGGINWIGSPGDVNGDRRSDLLGRTRDGDLLLYAGNGRGGFSLLRRIGHGWGSVATIAAPGDLDGDGLPDLVGRAADGRLVRYELTRAAGANTVGTVGTGWGGISRILGVGGIRNDVPGDLLATTGGGRLYAYWSNGRRLYGLGQVGHGFTGLMGAPGDVTGDLVDDVVRQSATLATHPVTSSGSVGAARSNAGSAAGFRGLA